MTDQNELDVPHPLFPAWTVREWQQRQAELGAEALEMAQLENAAAAAEHEANEAFRDDIVARVELRMRAEGWSEASVVATVQGLASRPNEFWGEVRAGRMPPDDM